MESVNSVSTTSMPAMPLKTSNEERGEVKPEKLETAEPSTTSSQSVSGAALLGLGQRLDIKA